MPPNLNQNYEEKVVRLDLSDDTADIAGVRWMNFQGIFKLTDMIFDYAPSGWEIYDIRPEIKNREWVLTFRRLKPIIPTESVSPTQVLESWDLLNVCGCGTVVLSTLVGSKPCKICQILGDSSSEGSLFTT